MFGIFPRPKDQTFNVAAIGESWLVRPLTHDGVEGKLHVRQLPSNVARRSFGFVALSQNEASVQPDQISALTKQVQRALEHDGACLLVLIHEVPGQVTWYAYAASRGALDKAFAAVKTPSVRWGINEDKGWLEYEHARSLVGA
jgi:hypothetical protein